MPCLGQPAGQVSILAFAWGAASSWSCGTAGNTRFNPRSCLESDGPCFVLCTVRAAFQSSLPRGEQPGSNALGRPQEKLYSVNVTV